MRQSKPIYVNSIFVWKPFFQRNGDDSHNMVVLSYWGNSLKFSEFSQAKKANFYMAST